MIANTILVDQREIREENAKKIALRQFVEHLKGARAQGVEDGA